MHPLTNAVDNQIGNLRINIGHGDGELIIETVHGPGLRPNVSEP
jgi:DNA-binding response OmpR family regulator